MSVGTKLAVGSPLEGARSSFDELDRLVRVTTIHGWMYLTTLFAVCTGAVAFAVLYEVPTKVNGEGILLIDRDALSRVRARATGRLISLQVQLGKRVSPGDTIGEISQNELEDAIQEATFEIEGCREDLEYTRHEQSEHDTQTTAIGRIGGRSRRAQATSLVKLKIAESIAVGDDRLLRAKKYLGDLEILETAREALHDQGRPEQGEVTAGRARPGVDEG